MKNLSIREMKKKKKGFTLIELIIVIAIIAVLAAIAIPKFGTVKKDANIAADKANGKNISLAIAKGIAEDKIKVPTASDTGDLALNALPGVEAATVSISDLIDGINETTTSKFKNATFTAKIKKNGDVIVKTGGVEVYPDAGEDYGKTAVAAAAA